MFTAFKRNESGVFYESNEFFCVCTRVYVRVCMYVSVCLWAMKSMHFPFYIHTTCLTSQSDVMELYSNKGEETNPK